MRDLPEEQDDKERPTIASDFISSSSPPQQSMKLSLNRAHCRVQPSNTLQRSIDEDITCQSCRAKKTGREVNCKGEIEQAGHRACTTKYQNSLWLHAP